MGLSEDGLYEPLRAFMLTRFGTAAQADIVFRLDRFGSVLTDGDFVLANQPDAGYNPALAAETFAELVNRIPIDLGDGRSVAFTDGGVDESYFYRLLSPSVPLIAPWMDPGTRQSTLESFSRIKADALRLWENATLASVSGLMTEYRASTATPRNWYDRTNAEGWSSHSFKVKGVGNKPADGSPMLRWRLKLDDSAMSHMLGLGNPEVLANPGHRLQLDGLVAAAQAVESPAAEVVSKASMDDLVGRIGLYDTVLSKYVTLPMAERVTTNRFLAERAPSVVAAANSDLSVSFEYSLVQIDQRYLLRSFLDQPPHWYVPGEAKGSLTRIDTSGGLGLLPVSVLVIRNLRITAAWSAQDVAAASVASDFGSFRVSGGIVDGALVNPGLQVGGWLFERMGKLPPNDPPWGVPDRREYLVKAGDSLQRIAAIFYGDGRRWSEIASRNNLRDPNKLNVGEHLLIP
jgi:hypothetical protein